MITESFASRLYNLLGLSKIMISSFLARFENKCLYEYVHGIYHLKLKFKSTVRFISLFAPSKNTKITQKSIEKPMEY